MLSVDFFPKVLVTMPEFHLDKTHLLSLLVILVPCHYFSYMSSY